MKHLLTLLLIAGGVYLSMAFIAPPLEREINLSLVNEPLRGALQKIQEQTGLIFSYKSEILQNTAPVSVELKHKSVREALALLLPRNIFYKSKSNYIILKERAIDPNAKKAELSGYVVDRNTNQKLPNVTIYDKSTLKSVTTDEYGYYSIKVPNENQCLKVNKEDYRDTCVALQQWGNFTNIRIDKVSAEKHKKDSLNWRASLREFSNTTNEFFKTFKGYINTINVKDTFTRNTQISLLPFVGSNGLMSGNVYNRFSFNVLGGYSRGTRALEVGGFFNVNKENMLGTQMAGFFNVVGDSVSGTQVAGFVNVSGRSMTGAQVSGFVNCNFGSVKGLQTAGFVNLNAKSVKGICLAGILNATRKSFEGVQLAGMMNVSADTLQGFSLAGIANLSWFSNKSVEGAVLLNHSQLGLNNVQISGLFNTTTKGSTRLQVSTLLNIADKLNGLQIGFINYSDTASGVPIGFFSIVKKGVHQLELTSDELFKTGLALRSGVPEFYNVFSFGVQPGSAAPLWCFGYGAGTSFKLRKKFFGDVTLQAQHISKGQFYHATSELYKLYVGVEYKVMNKLSLAAGPTFNLYWSDALLPDYAGTYSNIAPYYSYNNNLPYDFNLKGWLGARVALRFL